MMSKFWSVVFLLLITVGLMVQDADARRFGGGRSFGVSRSASSFTRSASATPNSHNTYQQAAPKRSGWLGPMAGFVMGGLLASLFMGHGLGVGLLTWVVLGLLILSGLNIMRRSIRPVTGAAQYGAVGANPFSGFTMNQPLSGVQTDVSRYPAGFEPVSFIRHVKTQFMLLQQAYDEKNLEHLRALTTPNVYTEIQMQLHERSNAYNHTEVVSIDAKLLDVVLEPQGILASVHFTGLVNENGVAQSCNEIWHFSQEKHGDTWLVAGVQQ